MARVRVYMLFLTIKTLCSFWFEGPVLILFYIVTSLSSLVLCAPAVPLRRDFPFPACSVLVVKE